MPSAFSMPPMRCSSPGVPGTAHGRARVFGSRWNGRNGGPAAAVDDHVPARELELVPQLRQPVHGWDPPRLRSVGQVAVRQDDHRGAVLDRDPDRLDRDVEAVGRGGRGDAPRPATRRCGRRAPSAGQPARSWSACRSTGRPAGCRR